jgi:hypothetical protein
MTERRNKMSVTKTAIVGLTIIFGLHAAPPAAHSGDRSPDESINYGVSVRQIDRDFDTWMRARLLQDFIYNKPEINSTTNIDTFNSFNAPGTGNSVAIGQMTEIDGCNGDANCEIMGNFKDTEVEASNTQVTTGNNPPAPKPPAR